MKKLIVYTTCLLIVFLLCACNGLYRQNILYNKVDLIKNATSNEAINTEVVNDESFSVYQITGVNDEFNDVILKNNIDINYNKHFYDIAITTSDMVNVEKKYIDIWIDEMNYSLGQLTLLLDENDRNIFLSLQTEWENNTINNLKLENDILTNSEKYDVVLGSSYQFQWLSEIREAYRKRTIKIKYLIYLLDSSIEFKN